jgi:acid phosphatase type 7
MPRLKSFLSVGLFALASAAIPVTAHDGPGDHRHDKPVGDWHFQPGYDLPRKAQSSVPRRANPTPAHVVLAGEPVRQSLLGAQETGRYGDMLRGSDLPQHAFTIELWVLEHVNTDVGALAGAFSGPGKRDAHWALGFYGKSLVFGALENEGRAITLDIAEADLEPYKRRWIQLIGSWDGEMLRLYHNGRLVGARSVNEWPQLPAGTSLELLSFTANEPYMQFENLVQGARIFDRALSGDAIAALFNQRIAMVDAGIVHPGLFHFTAGPYLNAPSETGISIVIETDRPSRLRLRYGPDTPPSAQMRSDSLSRLHTVTLAGLEADTPYFYEAIAVDEAGQEISSGVMTFQTAVRPGQPFRFAMIGDTEARPFINNAVAQGVWDARPHLTLLLGDLTDGGMEDRRFEWTHEYFTGYGPLARRVPTLAAPGNGEADLYWYRHYHALPGEENFYSLRYGDVEFFVLDSNLGDRENDEPGFRERQRQWLERALVASDAKWKIAMHHHPVYTSDEDDYGDSWRKAGREIGDTRVRNDFMDLYDRYGVDIVLYGHMHVYERMHPMREGNVDVRDGVVYIGSGGGGGNPEDFTPTRQGYSATTYRGYSYGLFDVLGNTIRYQLRDTEGRLRDTMTLVKRDGERGVLIEHAVAGQQQAGDRN